MKYLLIALQLFFICNFTFSEMNEVKTIGDERRGILKYGIDKQVIQLVEELTKVQLHLPSHISKYLCTAPFASLVMYYG